MLYARLVQRGNRQVLLTTDVDRGAPGKYAVNIETNYQGDYFVSLDIGGYDTRLHAYDAMMLLTDDEVMTTVMNVVEAISEDEGH